MSRPQSLPPVVRTIRLVLRRQRAEDAALVGPDVVETGYWLRADAIGHGYATEAIGALLTLAFSRLGARGVAVCHDPVNVASEGVPRRLGFRHFDTVTNAVLPGRRAANGSVRSTTKVWVLEAPPASFEPSYRWP